jgi:hypothetical protein
MTAGRLWALVAVLAFALAALFAAGRMTWERLLTRIVPSAPHARTLSMEPVEVLVTKGFGPWRLSIERAVVEAFWPDGTAPTLALRWPSLQPNTIYQAEQAALRGQSCVAAGTCAWAEVDREHAVTIDDFGNWASGRNAEQILRKIRKEIETCAQAPVAVDGLIELKTRENARQCWVDGWAPDRSERLFVSRAPTRMAFPDWTTLVRCNFKALCQAVYRDECIFLEVRFHEARMAEREKIFSTLVKYLLDRTIQKSCNRSD